MLISATLKQQRAEVLSRMTALSEHVASENRTFNSEEARDWDRGENEVRALDASITRQEAAEQLARSSEGGTRLTAIDDRGERHPILRTADKFADRYPMPSGAPKPNIAAIVKALATGDFPRELRDMSEAIPGAGGYTVPQPLAAQWLDLVRAATVCIELGAGTIDMTSETLKIAQIVTDVAPAFRAENVALPASDVAVGQVLLTAHTAGVETRASLELISDSPNASDIITTSITSKLGLLLDSSMLSGDGTGSNPTGILSDPNVNQIAAVGAPATYDPFLDAMTLIEVANMQPDGVVLHPTNWNEWRKLATGISGDKTKLRMPDDFAALPRRLTTGIAAGNAIVADWDMSCLFGMRAGVQLEASRYSGSTFSNYQLSIRGVMRIDTVRVRPKGVTRLVGIT
jgi:HK97 family phage major capsid protein